MRSISIREEIVIFGWESQSFFVDCLNVLAWRGVLNGDAEFWSSINVFDQLIDIFVPHPGISIVEILTECMEQVAGFKV